MKPFSLGQQIYLSFLILGVIVVLVLFFILLYRNFLKKKRLKRLVYRYLYHYAEFNDYLLLNDYFLHLDQNNVGHIDHILITNKYIYLIHDFSISGLISGKYNDEQLILSTRKEDKSILNPLNYNRNLAKRVALYNDLDNNFIKGIVVINDDAVVDISDIPTQFYITRRCELKKVIKSIEGEDVKPFKEENIVRFINQLDKNNLGEEKK